MASSPPVEPPTPEESPPPETKWPLWRVTMLIGALILLAGAILDTAVEDLPGWIRLTLFFVGYVFLAYGFFTALSARRGGPTPRDRG